MRILDNNELKRLLVAYAADKISKPDLMVLLDYVADDENGELDKLMDELLQHTLVDPDQPINSEKLYNRITNHSRFNMPVVRRTRRFWWVGAAAAILVAAGIFIWDHGRMDNTGKVALRNEKNATVIR